MAVSSLSLYAAGREPWLDNNERGVRVMPYSCPADQQGGFPNENI
jgi:hypothetical protein